MSIIAEETIQDIRQRVDIVEVVGSYLPLKRSGANHLGLCPFHQEKTPSFNVNEPRQIFHCFGCGVGGDVFSFLMRMEGLPFPEAVKRLGEKVGIEVEETADSPAEIQRREQHEQLWKINAAACVFFHQMLLEDAAGGTGRRYLRQRGYDGDTVREFRLGFAPDAWESLVSHLGKKGFSGKDLIEAGLAKPGKEGRSPYDVFRNRLIFPIFDLQERVVAFGGRVLDESLPKYINSPATPVYQNGKTLYGLCQARDAIRRSRQVLVVEGYFDLLALSRCGYNNVVATCGTALTADHARLLKRYAEKVLLVFDEDKAGRQASFRAMEALLPAGLTVQMAELPAGADPDSFLQERGESAFGTIVDSARPALEVFMEDRLAAAGQDVEGLAKAAEEVLRQLRRLPGELERDLYVQKLVAKTGLSEDLVRGRSQSIPAERQPASRRAVQPASATTTSAQIERTQGYLLRLMLASRDMRQRVADEGLDSLFLDEVYHRSAAHLLSLQQSDGGLPENLAETTRDPELQSILVNLMLEEDASWMADAAGQIFAGCRRSVQRERLRQRLRELDRLQEEARQRGDEAAENQCLRERMEINQEIKKVLEKE